MFLSQKGQVFTCGHGQGGRLGHGDEQTYLVSIGLDIDVARMQRMSALLIFKLLYMVVTDTLVIAVKHQQLTAYCVPYWRLFMISNALV